MTLKKWPLDTPVVWQIELPPFRVIKRLRIGPLGIPFNKRPPGIKILAHPWFRSNRRLLNSTEYEQNGKCRDNGAGFLKVFHHKVVV